MRRSQISRQPSQGFVLVIVLGLLLAMTVLVLGLNRRSRQALHISDAWFQRSRALAGAQAALQTARHWIQQVENPSTDKRLQGVFQEPQTFSLGDTACSLALSDESGKLNLNRLVNAESSFDRSAVERLLRLIDVLNRQYPQETPIGYGIVPALIDWTDKDDKVTVLDFIARENRGAESNDYRTSDPPRTCANDALRQVEELQWIRGVSPSVWERLSPFVTVYGDGLINLNTASREVLEALSEHIDATVADLIVEQRTHRPLAQWTDLQRIPGITAKATQDLRRAAVVGTSGPYYRVLASGHSQGQQRRVEALIKKNTTSKTVDVLRYREL